jgi:deoxyribonuclease V
MNIKDLHPWTVTYRRAAEIQQELRKNLILNDDHFPAPIKTIAGADISYSKHNDLFFAAVILLEFPSMTVVEERTSIERALFPYIPGLLSFREGPALLKIFERLHQVPDVVIFDGQGIAHPRGIGLASHMGLFLDIPTIGCAKKRLVGRYDDVGKEAGDYADLIVDERVAGAVLRTKKKVKPVFVSPGHKIGIGKSRDIVLRCCQGYKLPEPTRRAHLLVNEIRRGEKL